MGSLARSTKAVIGAWRRARRRAAAVDLLSPQKNVGIDDDELGRLLVDAGMPGAEVPRLLGLLNAHWAGGGSLEALLARDDILRRWALSPGGLVLLRSILGISRGVPPPPFSGEEEEEATTNRA